MEADLMPLFHGGNVTKGAEMASRKDLAASAAELF